MKPIWCAVVLALLSAPVAADEQLDEIVALSRAGAPGLALRMLDPYQDGLTGAAWAAAERERLHILAARGQWRDIVSRFERLPYRLPRPFLDWRVERQAEALLELGDGRGALDVLRGAIWGTGAPDTASLRRWRTLVLRAYLAEDDLDAALLALRRYQQDYGVDDTRLRALHGEALLRAGRADEALAALGEGDDLVVAALRELAILGADGARAPEVLERAVQAGSANTRPEAARAAAWRIAATAARRLGNHAATVAAIERSLLIDDARHGLPGLLRTAPVELWRAYVDWGRALGNAAQLIVGVDEDWVAAAQARHASEPAAGRALDAALAAHTQDPEIARQAHLRFAASLAAQPAGNHLLAAVFLDGGLMTRVEDIPPAIRHILVGEAVRRGDIELASRMVADLRVAPGAADEVPWALRRARVLVLAGRAAEGHAVLDELLDSRTEIELDALLQVLFDLQQVDAHGHALALFERVLARAGVDAQQQREILFWMAESHRALGDALQAARLFLRSATLDAPFAMDPWAQTARFQAAESLARAGLIDDASAILQGLLNATEDPARRAVLRDRIEQLRR